MANWPCLAKLFDLICIDWVQSEKWKHISISTQGNIIQGVGNIGVRRLKERKGGH